MSCLFKRLGGYFTDLKYINAYNAQNDLLIGANPALHKEILKTMNSKINVVDSLLCVMKKSCFNV